MIPLLAVSAVLLAVAQCGPFEVSLITADQYAMGKPVLCEVVLTNTLRDKDLDLYARNTPQGGIKSDIFSVSRNGKKIQYDGLVFKKVPVDRDSRRVTVAGADSTSIKVDLSMAYAMSGPGSYSVQLTTDIFYQDKAGNVSTQHITSQSAAFDIIGNEDLPVLTLGERVRLGQRSSPKKQVVLSMASALAPNFTGEGDSVDHKIALTAWNDAYTSIVASAASVKKEDEHFVKWFGAGDKDDGRMITVQGEFEDIQLSMEKQQYILYFKGPECERDDFAYTSAGSIYIYLCMGYFRAQDTHDYNSKLGTFVHMLGVAAGNLVDYPRIDNPEECQNLAQDVPLRAIRSACNYQYYVEDTDSE